MMRMQRCCTRSQVFGDSKGPLLPGWVHGCCAPCLKFLAQELTSIATEGLCGMHCALQHPTLVRLNPTECKEKAFFAFIRVTKLGTDCLSVTHTSSLTQALDQICTRYDEVTP